MIAPTGLHAGWGGLDDGSPNDVNLAGIDRERIDR
jgi:hypothetical protein